MGIYKEKKDNELLSIIIPVYNTSEYLKKCIFSILFQDYSPVEIILVDDGSDHDTALLCDYYSKEYSNVKVYHQKNRGQYLTRNIGVEHASGKYIAFVDSDDYVDATLFNIMMNKILNNCTDMVTSDFLFEEKDGFFVEKSIFAENNYYLDQIKDRLIYDRVAEKKGIIISLAGKIFMRDIWLDSVCSEFFDTRYGEDLAALLCYISNSKKIYVCSYAGYHYVQREDSSSHKINLQYFSWIVGLRKWIAEKSKIGCIDQELGNQADFFIRDLVLETVSYVFPGLECGVIAYVPPYEKIPSNCRLAVYGAGKVGRSMVKCLINSGYSKVVSWFDRASKNDNYILPIKKPDEIVADDFDYILIAIAEEKTAKEVMEQLKKMNISENRMIWSSPFGGG